MEFKIFDGRTEFFQWDLKQKLILEGFNNVEQVHFDDGFHENAFVNETYRVDNKLLVDVPSDALTIGGSIKVYAYDIDSTNGDRTLYVQRFIVNRRAKPADYVYEERDVRRLEDLIKMTEDFINNSVNDELNEAKNNLDSYNNAKKSELDAYEKAKENEIQAKVDSFTDYSDTQKRLANIENMKLAYFDDEGFINIKEKTI